MKLKMKEYSVPIIFLAIFVGIPIGLVVIMIHQDANRKPPKEFTEFYENEVYGNIVEYSMGTAGVMTFRTTDPLYKTYKIWPLGTKGKRFSQTVAKGDSILKEAYSDFFVLKKRNGEKYKYKFSTHFFLDENR